jgi:hypothetical protein
MEQRASSRKDEKRVQKMEICQVGDPTPIHYNRKKEEIEEKYRLCKNVLTANTAAIIAHFVKKQNQK